MAGFPIEVATRIKTLPPYQVVIHGWLLTFTNPTLGHRGSNVSRSSWISFWATFSPRLA